MTTLQIILAYLSLAILGIMLLPRTEKQGIQILALIASSAVCYMFLVLWGKFDPKETGYQFISSIALIPQYNLNLTFGADALSFYFALLTSFLMPLCIFSCDTRFKKYKQYIIYLLLIELLLLAIFLTTNGFYFFVFFEGVLIPMFLIIGIWGSRERRTLATYYLVLYTIFGSFFLLYGLLYVYNITGSLDNDVLLHVALSKEDQIYVFIFFFIPFAIKIPMFPFHIWLPEAHVEAPTIGSVILAGLLLKLGGYGFLRYTLQITPAGCDHYIWLINALAVLGIIYASLAVLTQSDIKRIIAYSSIAHMNLAVIGIFSDSVAGITGAMYLMLSHGIVSPALFFCAGILYDRHHSRSLKTYSGLALVMPIFCAFFFIFICANMSFPLTANFVGEFLIFVGISQSNNFLLVFAATSIFLSAVYSIWCFNRMSFGTLKIETENIVEYSDLNRKEFIILFVLFIGMLVLGLNSSSITDAVDTYAEHMLTIISSKK